MKCKPGKGKSRRAPVKVSGLLCVPTDNDFVLRKYVGTCEVFVGGVVLE